jgi:hypothetical protein
MHLTDITEKCKNLITMPHHREHRGHREKQKRINSEVSSF